MAEGRRAEDEAMEGMRGGGEGAADRILKLQVVREQLIDTDGGQRKKLLEGKSGVL
jgi:hypothetical protein